MAVKDRAIKYLNSITIEPMIFSYMLGQFIVDGAQLNTNLLIEKVCRYEFHFNETVCSHLDAEENDAIESTGTYTKTKKQLKSRS